MQFGGVAACDSEQQPPQCGLLQRIEPTDRPEVDESKLTVAQHQDIAGMGVGVERPVDHHLAEHRREQAAR